MPTIADALVLQIGLDPSDFVRGQKQASQSFVKTKKEAERQGKDIEEAGKRASEAFYGRLKRESLSFLAALAGAAGLKEFVAQITHTDAATGRLAHNLGISTKTLSSWQMAAQRVGGTAQGMGASFQSFANSVQALRTTGDPAILQWLVRLQSAGGRQIDPMKKLDESFLDMAHDFHALDQQNPMLANFIGRQLGLDQGTINLLLLGDVALKKILADAKKFAATKKDKDAATERQMQWIRLSQIFTELGRTIVTDLTPALVPLLKLLENLGEWLDRFARAHPLRMDAIAAFIALIAGAKIFTGIRALLALKNALLGVAAAETAVTAGATGGGLLALLGKLGAIGLAGYALGKTLEPTTAGGGEDEAKRQRDMAARGLDPNGKPLKGSSSATTEAYIRQAATARGINPDVAVAVARSEGLNKYVGDRGTSFGPFQLHYGGSGIPGMNVSGLGDVFTRQTGLDARNPTTTHQQIDFALDYAARHGWGPWHGWKGLPFAGISQRSLPTITMLHNLRSLHASHKSVSSSSQTRIGQITVHTQATDAPGIARDIGKSLQKFPLTIQSDYGPI